MSYMFLNYFVVWRWYVCKWIILQFSIILLLNHLPLINTYQLELSRIGIICEQNLSWIDEKEEKHSSELRYDVKAKANQLIYLNQELHENDRALHALHKETENLLQIKSIDKWGSKKSNYWALYLNTFSWNCFMLIILINI